VSGNATTKRIPGFTIDYSQRTTDGAQGSSDVLETETSVPMFLLGNLTPMLF